MNAMRSSLLKMINNMKLRKKMIITYLIIVIIPVPLVGYLSYKQAENSLLEHKRESIQYTVKQISSNINNELKPYLEISNIIMYNPTLNTYLNQDYTNDLDRITGYRFVSTFLESIVNNSKLDLKQITVYNRNTVLYKDQVNTKLLETDFEKPDIIKQLSDKNKYLVWIPTYEKDGQFYFSFYRLLDYNLQESSTILETIIYERSLYKLINEESADKEIMVVDRDGIVMSSSNRSMVGKQSYDYYPYIKEISGEKTGYLQVKGRDSMNIVVFDTTIEGWRVIAQLPTNALLTDIKNIKKYVYVTCMVSVVFCILLAILFSSLFQKRIDLLRMKMKTIQKGKFDVDTHIQGEDEIADLDKSLDTLALKLQLLFKEVNERMNEKREEELNALYSQINSHFLYNTLSSIRWLAVKYTVAEIRDIVDMLAKFYRVALTQNEIIPINDEIEHLKAYLNLQQIRYKNALQVEYLIDEEVLHYKIVKLILQPLVENSIYHGRGEDDSITEILVKGYRQDDRIIFEIEDNGNGIDESILQSLRDKTYKYERSTSGGYGIANVDKRIKLNCGAQYGVEIYNKADQGVRVVITVPVIKA